MRSCDVVVRLKIVKGLSVIYMIAMSDSASDHSLSLNFSLLSSLSKWLQVFFYSSCSAHALRSSLPPSQQCAVHPKHATPFFLSPIFTAYLCSATLLLSALPVSPKQTELQSRHGIIWDDSKQHTVHVDWDGVKILDHEQSYWKRTLEAIWIQKTELRGEIQTQTVV